LHFTGLTKDNAPKLLSDNGKCYLSGEIKDFLSGKGIKPINGKPCHLQTQWKIERYQRTMKNVIWLDNYYSLEDLIRSIGEFVKYYNNERYHESLGNLTPDDVYCGRDRKIVIQRIKIKEKTLSKRRKNYIIEKLKLNYETL
jgi:transposase InsO family protein